ncbi:type 1 periplasmic binding fold superfamily protein [Kordia sp. YSTF-M3]|uniref:Type 1 periplasmic binding fold superfamily protein n=1 Tax=Kordia aestuariivivens TaxID=2759037 RepID=A0ABR7Q976_9FLAO|nr:type 1 periplasmic binding fold superfamily protein [Kordia aestuariivivens]MBC8755110.1 type 1 periplasmic binding fold superfamily protein [Kordia aestuariivivens]
MNTYKFSTLVIITLFSSLFIACSSDDDAPVPVNEEELITTVTVTLTPTGGGTAITLESSDLDGDGPNDPVITVSGDLAAMTTYNGAVVLLNETVTPADNITSEVQAEAEEHQFFYTTNASLDLTTSNYDLDANMNPLGITFDLTTGAASTGTFTVTLRHEPTKPNTGLADAGGETDISSTFTVTVQ